MEKSTVTKVIVSFNYTVGVASSQIKWKRKKKERKKKKDVIKSLQLFVGSAGVIFHLCFLLNLVTKGSEFSNFI